VAVGCSAAGRGVAPQLWTAHPPGASPKYPDPGQQWNYRSESQGDRILSGAGFFPCDFPNPPTTCLNFSLWKDYRFGVFGVATLAAGGRVEEGFIDSGRAVRLIKPTVLWTTIPPRASP